MPKSFLRIGVILALFAVATYLLVHRAPTKLYTLTGNTMGTSYSITIDKIPDGINENTLRDDIEKRLDELNQIFSTYDPESELSKLNQAPIKTWIPVSNELLTVIKAALDISERSDGAFDVTVGPLVDLWGFGPKDTEDQIPSQQDIDKALQEVGYNAIEIKNNQIYKHKTLEIDLSAIAKGYAVDTMAAFLAEKGIKHLLVEIGGEIQAVGKKSEDEDWKIGIEAPLDNERKEQKIIPVSNYGVATSGDYRNFFMKNGKRYSHTIDPLTGRPIEHRLASVTILQQSTMLADGWATAMMVLGPEKGLALAEKEKLAAFFIVRESDQFKTLETTAFTDYLKNKNLESSR